jgi:hypothetical protein
LPREITTPFDRRRGPVVAIEIQPLPEERATLAAQGYRRLPVRMDALLDTGASRTLIPVGIGESFGLKRRDDARNLGIGIGPIPVTTRCYVVGITVAGIDMGPVTVEAGEFNIAEAGGFRALIGRDFLSLAEFTYIGGNGREPDKFRLAFPEPPAEPGTIMVK